MCIETGESASNYSLESLEKTLLNEEEMISKRTRAVFLLKQLNTEAAIDILVKAMRSPSVLLGHEVAYVLGQMRNVYVLPKLIETMKDTTYHPIVRHEAAEAIGAIGLATPENIALLEEYSTCDTVEVAETCQIAVERLRFLAENPTHHDTYQNNYHSVDPAPPCEEDDVEKIKAMLIDQSLPLFVRYRAMFKLRDYNTPEAIAALCCGFADSSALFRHEIAYVFGQLSNPLATDALIKVVQTPEEHSMVRHEAAEALGSIADMDPDNTKIIEVLIKGKDDPDRIVKESCDVAIDIFEYWQSDEIETAIDEEVEDEPID